MQIPKLLLPEIALETIALIAAPRRYDTVHFKIQLLSYRNKKFSALPSASFRFGNIDLHNKPGGLKPKLIMKN
ncbi:jg7413 [Pararge aegeria aegeria]|uniref:Jg7413 protein n=1 Tax=Pararge aegeria aegeria TaxID=348720 RepID=A0A8S4RPC1_9NEOP|nr:jg7413 [Pararge aegeria aegeria]